MKINKVQIRNFRIHENLTVEFAKDCTVITGLNESGKSTLFEAIHCALFMKHRKSGELLEAIRRRDAEHPEVELWFEAQSKSWHLKKRFAGASARSICSLSDGVNQPNLGEDAEAALAGLVRFDLADPTDGNREKLRGNASHLWVWQGSSGENPAGELAKRQNAVADRLQEAGVAGIIQSQRDARIASIFEQQRSELLTDRQQPKANTELARVSEKLSQLQASVSKQRELVRTLDAAARDHDEAMSMREESLRELERLNAERLALAAKAAHAAEIKAQLDVVEERKARYENERDELFASEQNIQRCRATLDAARRGLEPGNVAASTLGNSRSVVILERDGKRAERNRASVARQVSERRHELADAWQHLLSLEKELAAADARVKTEESLVDQLNPLISRLAKLPVIDRDSARRIARLEHECQIAKTRLEAASAQITVDSASCPIMVDGVLLESGVPWSVSSSARIVVGDVAELTLRAGGESLGELQAALDAARAELKDALVTAQATSAAQAEDIASEREGLTRDQRALQQRLDSHREQGGRNHSEIQADISQADARVNALRDLEALRADPEAASLLLRPASTELAKQSAQLHRQSAMTAHAFEMDLIAELDGLERQIAELTVRLEEQTKSNSEAGEKLAEIQGSLNELLRVEGEDEARAQKGVAIAAELQHAASDLRALQERLDRLDPDRVQLDRTRVDSLIESNQNHVSTARESLTRTRTILLSDGASDPRRTLSELEGQRDFCEAEERILRTRCDAIALLDKLFREAREHVGTVLGAALAERVAPYLRMVFGTESSMVITRTERGDYTLRLKRTSGATEDFDTLSGGTKEQVATAVRLATAELLAKSFNGCLPLVFDDAFVNSDSERTKNVARMLFRATERGVQVIIGSCQPGDYKDLPGVRIELKPPAFQPLARDSTTPRGPWPAAPAAGGTSDDHEQFVAVLRELGGNSGNQSLRTELGWDVERYTQVKESLLVAGRVIPGPGRGGSLRLAEEV